MTLAGISLKTALQACWLLHLGWETTGPCSWKDLQGQKPCKGHAGYFPVPSLATLQ